MGLTAKLTALKDLLTEVISLTADVQAALTALDTFLGA